MATEQYVPLTVNRMTDVDVPQAADTEVAELVRAEMDWPTASVTGDGLFPHGFVAVSECRETGFPVAWAAPAPTGLTVPGRLV